MFNDTIGAGRRISLTCAPGVRSLRRSNALIWLMPPMMKMSSPQDSTWLPTRTVALRPSRTLKSFDTQASSHVQLLTAMSLASDDSGVRRVSSVLKSFNQLARISARQPSVVFRPNSWLPFSGAETMSPRL